MAKSLSSLWLKSLTRIAKAQQKQLLKSMATAAKKTAKTAKPAVKKALVVPKAAAAPAPSSALPGSGSPSPIPVPEFL